MRHTAAVKLGNWFSSPVMKHSQRLQWLPRTPLNLPNGFARWGRHAVRLSFAHWLPAGDRYTAFVSRVCASGWLCSRIDSLMGAICQQAFDDNRPWCDGTDPSGSPLHWPRCHFDEAEVIMALCACARECAVCLRVCVCASYSALSLHYRFNLSTIHTHTCARIFSLRNSVCLSVRFFCSHSLPVRSLFTSAAIINCCWPMWGFTNMSVNKSDRPLFQPGVNFTLLWQQKMIWLVVFVM